MSEKQIKTLLYADVIWFFGEGMLGPLFAVFTQRVGGDVLDITSAWATYLIVVGILTVLIGKMSDKWDKRKLVFGGYVLNAVLTFGYLFVDSSSRLLLIQCGLGIAAAMATPTWNALYSEYTAKSKRSRKNIGLDWGLADGFSQFFTGIAILIGGAIVTYFSFDALFIVMGIVQVISVIILVPILSSKR